MAWVETPEIVNNVGRASLIRGILNNINTLKNTEAIELFTLDYNNPYTVSAKTWQDSGVHVVEIDLPTTAALITFTFFWVAVTVSSSYFNVDLWVDGNSISLEQGMGDEYTYTNHSATVTAFVPNLTPGTHEIRAKFKLFSTATGYGQIHGVSYLSVIGL